MVTKVTAAKNVAWSNLVHTILDVQRAELVQSNNGIIPTQVELLRIHLQQSEE